MDLDTRKIVTPGFNPGVHLSGVTDGRELYRATRVAPAPSRDS